MIVLDTNVVSELMREKPEPNVIAWATGEPSASLYTTTVTEAEVFFGIALVPKGKRRLELEAAAERVFAAFDGRVLPFDSSAARELGEIAATRRRAGRALSMADAQIAAIARVRSAKIATRDTADFSGCGVEIVNPWK